MGEACTEVLNKVIKPSYDVKSELISFLSLVEQKISKLKDVILFDGSSEPLSVFSTHGESFLEEITKLKDRVEQLGTSLSSSIQAGKSLAQKIIPDLLQMRALQTAVRVAEREEDIARYRSEVSAARIVGSLEMSLESFSNLSVHLGTSTSSFLPVVLPLPPFYCATLEYFTKMFQDTLNEMELPKIKPATNCMEYGTNRFNDRCPWNENTLQTFRSLYQTLNSIVLPERVPETDAAKRAHLSIPVRLILEPLEKRFLFNFYGNRITNKPEQPEWYFTEILTWITINDQWLTWMQDEQLKNTLTNSTNLRVEFMKGLISFVMDKISFDLGLLSSPPKPRCAIHIQESEAAADSATSSGLVLVSPPPFFGHLTDEMLTFEACLDGLCYQPQALRPADLFTRRLDVLQHWVALESDLAHKKLKDLLAKPYAWKVDNKVPHCVGDFLSLVYSISRRAAHLHHSAAKSRVFFFKVQLDLIFTFLEVVTAALPWNASTGSESAILNAFDEDSRDHLTRWTSILNALQTVLETMQEWSNDQFFVELWEDQESHRLIASAWDPWMDEEIDSGETSGWKSITHRLEAALTKTDTPEVAKTPEDARFHRLQCPGVFAEISELYRRRIEKSLQVVEQSLFSRLRELAQPYLIDTLQWSRVDGYEVHSVTFTTPPPPVTGLSGHAAELFARLNCDLSVTFKTLLTCLFTALWQPILREINQLFYNKLILKNRFTAGGASQLRYDLGHCLRALLMPYSDILAVDDILAECLDAYRLLTLPPGSIQLLKQSLVSADTSTVVIGPLVELGIRRLAPEDALAVLSHYIPSVITSDSGGDYGAEADTDDFDSNALRDLDKKYQLEVERKRAELEVSKGRVVDSVCGLTSQLSLNLNKDVSVAYDNQCLLNTEVKKLHSNILAFSRQVDLWNKEISEITSALKELGDVETWSQKLCRDVQVIHDALEAANQ